MIAEAYNLTGKRIGRFLVLGPRFRKQGRREWFWACQCDCGDVKALTTHDVCARGQRPCRCEWFSPLGKPPLCECGCGQKVTGRQGRKWNRFLLNHRNRKNREPGDIRLGKWLRGKYGLTLVQYRRLVSDQEALCKICHNPNPNTRGTAIRFCVDHDHHTQKIRGLLCFDCNSALGLFHDNPFLCRDAAKYLRTDWARVVPREFEAPALPQRQDEGGGLPFCRCGCGLRVLEASRQFRKAHHFRKYPVHESGLAKRYAAKLKREYGLTLQSYRGMEERQGGRCQLCKTESPGKNRKHFCVDHDHATGQVRALLCGSCNSGLAGLKDNPDLCDLAAKYLETGGLTPTGLVCRVKGG